MQIDRDAAGAAEAFESFPEVILPAQMDFGGRFGIALGERRLLWAMLLDAASCFYKHRNARDNTARKLFREAERWIRCRDDGTPFSFHAVCDVLGLNAHQVRVSLLQCVYGNLYDPTRFADESGRPSERGPRQLRDAPASRSAGGNGAARIRPHRIALGGRRELLARAVSYRG
jgi:hypothetical protein